MTRGDAVAARWDRERAVFLDRFRERDIPGFLALAGQEGWVCDEWEFAFLLAANPGGCLVVREGGLAVAYVTTCRHQDSAWLGNLLVAPEWRGQGFGRLLMEAALAEIDRAGPATVWLTASPEGLPLYERLGFGAIDRVSRWRGVGIQGEVSVAGSQDPGRVVTLDSSGWGDRRELLVLATIMRGRLLAGPDAFLVLQPTGGGIQVGPWGGEPAAAGALLRQGMVLAGPGAPLFLDVPERNQTASALLAAAGFTVCGGTVLMWRGAMPAYRPEQIFALASMGSMG